MHSFVNFKNNIKTLQSKNDSEQSNKLLYIKYFFDIYQNVVIIIINSA